ncbi:MAG: cbb3-type cytochrome c oxidase subunit 3 [Cytophagales bacterium]|nr:cbb3-type cytochrome c oxidase subunit 3 [Cytophagales bacterium]
MKKEALLAIDNVEIYPVISFVLYGLFFAGVLFYISFKKKSTIQKMKDLPLD